MLCLSRMPGESLVIVLPDGRECVVQVLEVRAGGQVRLGLTAPRDVVILREELMPPRKEGA